VIPPQRNNSTNTKVSNLRKHYENGSYACHPRLDKWILVKRLVLKELAPMCQEIKAINQYRFMDYVFHLDASCLNDNIADRNKVAWFSGLETIKRVTGLTHNLEEQIYSWQLEDLESHPNDWARGLKFFSNFKNWALSYNHQAAHQLVCTLENKMVG
jgi:hypothetical protein